MIIPVFDVKDGMFVCGKSGKRASYCELVSVYGENPSDIVCNLKESGAKYVYIADLDKIEGVGDNSSFIQEINEAIPVLLDNGANCVDDVIYNRDICTFSILASETMTNIADVYRIFEEMPFENVFISIDLKDGNLLVNNKNVSLDDVISLVNDVRPAYTLLLNVSQVGTMQGNDDSFVKDIIGRTLYTQHIIAGGVTNESIHDYKEDGIDNFLVGTLLHNGGLLEEYKW